MLAGRSGDSGAARTRPADKEARRRAVRSVLPKFSYITPFILYYL
ncbi:MAG: hypothetical protein WAP36_02120 [Halanaerobiales bacterium]